MHRLVLHNDEIRDARDPDMSPGQVGLLAGWGVFSTLRVSRGVLFAFERHWKRMERDAKRMHVPFPRDAEWMYTRLLRLIDANSAQDATLRVYIVRNKGGIWEGPGIDRDFDLIAFTTDLNNWGEGVRLGIQPHARHAQSPFAGAKINSWADNLTWYEQAHERGFDEVILLNERGEVSECTSANIFAIFGDEVVTPPLTDGCLPGITREILLEDIRAGDISFGERTLLPSDLEKANGLFITSSTRDVLPVHAVDGLTIERNSKIVPRLQAAFQKYRERYVEERTRASQAQGV